MADTEKEKKPSAKADTAEETSKDTENTAAAKEEREHRMSAAARKRLRYGGVATAITVVVVAIVVLLNVVVDRLVQKYPIKIDLTENSVFEIGDETIDYIKSIDKDVSFTVLADESSFQTSLTYFKMVSEVLERYTQYSGHISLRYVDPTTNPDVVSRFQTYYTGTLGEGSIIVSDAGDDSKLRVVSVYDLFTYDQTMLQYYQMGYVSWADCVTGFAGEEKLTAAVMYVCDANPVSVGVLAKANGADVYAPYYSSTMAVLEQTLTNNGYDVTELDMVTDAFDVDKYDMLILPAPYNDVTTDVVEKLSAYLHNDGQYGRSVIYIADFTQGATPNLDSFTESYGLRVSADMIGETNSDRIQQVLLSTSSSFLVGAIGVSPAEETFSAQLANTSLPIVAPSARNIELLWDSKTAGITSALLQTSDSACLFDSDGNPTDTGTHTVMAVSRRSVQVDFEYGGTSDSYLMVIDSMGLVDAAVMQNGSYNNAPYLISAVNVMTGKDSGLVIASKALTTQTIAMTDTQKRNTQIAVYAIPFIVTVIGIVVFIRRRNK